MDNFPPNKLPFIEQLRHCTKGFSGNEKLSAEQAD